jgi:hypothetical protein
MGSWPAQPCLSHSGIAPVEATGRPLVCGMTAGTPNRCGRFLRGAAADGFGRRNCEARVLAGGRVPATRRIGLAEGNDVQGDVPLPFGRDCPRAG